jgi:hypothetical protein
LSRARDTAALCLVLIAAVACGDDDDMSQGAVEGDHSPSSERDSGGETPGSGSVGQLRDAGTRRDAEAGNGGRDDAGSRRDGGDPDCEPSGSKDDCDGVDEDCDGEIDEDFAPSACDGKDSDLCRDGSGRCEGAAGVRCDDDSQSALDVCNGEDDDCDPTSADGSDEPTFSDRCDGPDADQCTEGAWVCDGNALHCSDDSGSDLDVCNGQDDDCDPATADGSAEPTLGDQCDGNDGDLCLEGFVACSAGVLGCSDSSGDALDVCNGADDDCDVRSADGSEDPQLGMQCDGPDDDVCKEGVYACSGGTALSCNDATASTAETCNGDDDDCDGNIEENVDTNPSCAGATSLGTVSGDLNEEILAISGGGEAWRTLRIREDQSSGALLYLSASITLVSGANSDYDLKVYCDACGGALAGESDNSAGASDFVDVRLEDTLADDSFTVVIQVIFYEAHQCTDWQLQVQSNTSVTTGATCE